MSRFSSFVSPLFQPLMLTVDFRSNRWDVSRPLVVGWIVLAVLADFGAQWAVGPVDYLRVAGSFLTFLLLMLPLRLAVAAAGLYVSQALISLLLWSAVQNATAGLGWLGYVVTYGWQGWSLLALGFLFLTYVRTPRNEFRHAAR